MLRSTLFAISSALLAGCAKTPVPSEANVAADKPFYQTIETPPAPTLNPKQALHSFALAPGYRIELVAAEPLLADPVAMDWDESGRIYVTEMRAYMPNLEGEGEQQPIGALVRLSDQDGDGVFDRREELIDDLVLPRAVRVVGEGLLVAEMGKLWLCPSVSGWSEDIDCASKRLLGAYGEHQGSVEHAENGLLVGVDNWIYNAKSARRLKLVDGRLVEEPTLFRGQWGIAQDRNGRLFYNTNSNLLMGDDYDAQVIVAAGNARAAGLQRRVSPSEEVFSVRVNTGVNRAYLPGVLREDGRLRNATSASGMGIDQGGWLGRLARRNAPNAFVAEPAANVVAAFRLDSSAAKLSAERALYADEKWGQRDFLASTDERFRPVDVKFGPDGALYVVDFYRGVIQDYVYLSDELKAQARARGLDRPLGMGRIWRIVPTSATAEHVLPEWRELDDRALLRRLDHPSGWHRATAQRLLRRHAQKNLHQLLAEVVRADGQAAVHALWMLADRGELSAALVKQAFELSAPVAEAALLAGGQLVPPRDLLALLERAEHGSRKRLNAIAALRWHNASKAVQQRLVALTLSGRTDAYVRDVSLAAARGEERAIIQGLLEVDDSQGTGRTELLGKLARQYFHAEGAQAAQLLDELAGFSGEQLDEQIAVLDGLFEATRAPGFVRAELPAAHPLFAIQDQRLWPALARARRGFTWPGDDLAADAKPLTPAQRTARDQGAKLFAASCANCHGQAGQGVGALGPPLADSVWVTQAPERLARIILHGLSGPIEVAGQRWNSAMPGHGQLADFDDAGIAGLMTYLRRAWGHSGRAIDAGFVRDIRAANAQRTRLWTVAELRTVPINTHFAAYAGRYGGSGFGLAFTFDAPDLRINAGIFEGPMEELREDFFRFAPRGMDFEFDLDDDGRVRGVRVQTGEGSQLLPRIEQ